MNQVISVYIASEKLDDQGRADRSQDQLVADCIPASIRALRGRELIEARKLQAFAEYSVSFHWDPCWSRSAKMYAVWHGEGRLLWFAESLRRDDQEDDVWRVYAGESPD